MPEFVFRRPSVLTSGRLKALQSIRAAAGGFVGQNGLHPRHGLNQPEVGHGDDDAV
ncbi:MULTISPECIES: hypothetical protein [Neisseria]|uniref:hypothetical protein n=1 Tax=Neisseria TaxID=482 RepID=UPI001E3D717C|nr:MULTISPECIES: hypothetical protein [Neisseria]